MTAKISDLGVARILNLTPLQVSRMTQTPGTPAYMPPEVMVANPKYDTSVDEFSYGIMMIHMFSGQWPEPQIGPNRTEPDGRMTPVSEAERREVFLRAIGNDHPLMDLILKCIHNYPKSRAHASEIVGRLAEMVLQFPASFANRLEMLRQIEADGVEKRALTEEGEKKDRAVQQRESQISSLREEVQMEKEQKSEEIDRLKLAHSTEVEQLRLQVKDAKTKNQYTKPENEAEIVELKYKHSALETQIENKTKILLEEREKRARQLREEQEQHEIQLRKKREQLEIQLEANRKLISDAQDLQSDLSRLKSEITTLQGTVTRLQSDITDKDTVIQVKETVVRRKDSELEAKSIALGEKDATISEMSEQITKARNYLATTKLQVSTYLKVTIFCRYIFQKFCESNLKFLYMHGNGTGQFFPVLTCAFREACLVCRARAPEPRGKRETRSVLCQCDGRSTFKQSEDIAIAVVCSSNLH